MTTISFTSGELLDIIDALEIKEDKAYIGGDKNLAAYYMNLGVRFQRVYDRLQGLPGEKREAQLVLAMNDNET